MNEHDPVRVEIYLDDSTEPLGIYSPPAHLELDTTRLPDGPHKITIRATDRVGVQGIRVVDFLVRNGPGIAVVGLKRGDIVEGKIPVLINAYAGAREEWEPRRAETPAPVPTWWWVLFLGIAAWAMGYWAITWAPTPNYANSPTFSAPEVIVAAALPPEGEALPIGAGGFDWTEQGARVFEERCVICHTSSGEGIPGFVASLVGSRAVTAADPTEHIERILYGSSLADAATEREWRAWMPAFGELLNDEEIAAVANYERTSWGNSAPTIRPEQVRQVRASGRSPR